MEPQRHGPEMFAAQALDRAGDGWAYLPYGPFADLPAYLDWMASTCLGTAPLFFAAVDQATGHATGPASYLRIAPEAGSRRQRRRVLRLTFHRVATCLSVITG